MKTQCVRGQFWIDFENFGLWLQRLEMPWIRSLPSGFVDAELSTIARAPVLGHQGSTGVCYIFLLCTSGNS